MTIQGFGSQLQGGGGGGGGGVGTLSQVLATGQIADDFIDWDPIATPGVPTAGRVRMWGETPAQIRMRFDSSLSPGLSIRNLGTNGAILKADNNLGLGGGEGGVPSGPHVVLGAGRSIVMGAVTRLGWAAATDPTQQPADVQLLRHAPSVVEFTDGAGLQVGIPLMSPFTVATLPAVGTAGGVIFVSDETGGATLAFSDGTNWRRVQDRAIVA